MELRGCRIKYSDSTKGFGIFSSNHASDGKVFIFFYFLAQAIYIFAAFRGVSQGYLGFYCTFVSL